MNLRRASFVIIVLGALLHRFVRKRVTRTDGIQASTAIAGWGRGAVGPDFFDRLDAVDHAQRLVGLVDDFSVFGRADFDPAELAPEIGAFYEQTLNWELDVVLAPTVASLPLLPPFIFLSWWWRQTEFPFTARCGQGVTSRIDALTSEFDARRGARVWVRTHSRSRMTDRVLYVTQYALTRHGGTTCMNIAFPLPPGNVTTLLRFDHLPGGAAALTSSDEGRPERAGTWQVFGRWAVRGPVTTTLFLYPAGHADVPPALERWGAGYDLLIEHEIRYFGVVLMRLRYRARRAT